MPEIKKAHDGAAQIKSSFNFLFNDGFQIVKIFDRLGFGNWIIVLQSEKAVIRIIQDREDVSIMIGPSHASTDIDDDQHFISLGLLADYFNNNEIPVLRSREYFDAYAKLEEIRKILFLYYDQIIALFNSDEFLKEEEEIRLFQKRQLKRAFPNARFRPR